MQTWLGAASVKKLTSQGHKVIDSDYNYWVGSSLGASPEPALHTNHK